VTALIAGEIDVMFSDTALVIPHAKPGGRLRILGVTGTQRMAALPEVPTLKEAGVPDYYLTFWYGAWVPAKTPAAIVARVDELLAKAMKSPAAQAFLKNGGADNFDLSGEAFAKFQVGEIARFGSIVKAANMEPQ
jgi:tripartite-type tricarboxylate transporter receptor subunit TctC